MTQTSSTFNEQVQKILQDEPEIERAADALWKSGTFYKWWSSPEKSWKDMDPLGQLEFLTVVGEIVDAYKGTAPAVTTANDPATPKP